jgi:phenylacetate-CoA ligase
VRYETGDLGTMTDTPCRCGRGLPRLKAIEGRVLDAMRTADGRTVPGEFFPILLLEIPEVAQFRVHQERIDRIVISAVLNGPVSESSATLLRREIQRVFGSTTVCTLLGVSHIPPLSSGKRRITVGMGA